MRARDRFQFASSRAGACPMHRQMFDTLVAPKTFDSRRSTASKIARVLPVTADGSTRRIVVMLPPSRTPVAVRDYLHTTGYFEACLNRAPACFPLTPFLARVVARRQRAANP